MSSLLIGTEFFCKLEIEPLLKFCAGVKQKLFKMVEFMSVGRSASDIQFTGIVSNVCHETRSQPKAGGILSPYILEFGADQMENNLLLRFWSTDFSF